MNSGDQQEYDSRTRLDITGEVCPMTFVRTRLALDRLPPGALLEVHLRGEEPLRNVPRTAAEQGHQVLHQDIQPDGSVLLLLRKKGDRKQGASTSPP